MAHITFDRVRDTTTTTGTGAITVTGTAPTSYRTFSSVASTNDTFYYVIQHQSADEFEVGLGTYSGTNQITRTTIYASSNANAAVNFSSGTKDVAITFPASRTVSINNSGIIPAFDASLLTNINASNISSGTIAAARVPTLNQNTTGTAANVTGTVAVGNGGTGATTLTGILKGNGTSAFTAATAGTDYVAPGSLPSFGGVILASGNPKIYYNTTATEIVYSDGTNMNIGYNLSGRVFAASSGLSVGATYGTASSYKFDCNGTSIFRDVKAVDVAGNQILLHNGNGSNTPSIIFRNDGASFYILKTASSTTPSGSWDTTRPFTIAFSNGYVSIANGLGVSGGLTLTGDFSATGNVTAYSSDKRLKKNVANITNPIEKLMSIGGYTFDWEDDCEELGFTPVHKENDIGTLAQEIQAVLPQAVALAPFDAEKNEDGEIISKSGKNYLTVQYERIVPLLIEAIKAQQVQIDELKGRLP